MQLMRDDHVVTDLELEVDFIRRWFVSSAALPSTLMADSATSPVTADFSSAPPKRTKIVLLGDQSVGKTSLITRYSFPFCSVLSSVNDRR